MYDYLIVGSGLFGATFAHQATKQGKKCLVIDKRPHLGGNVYCENVEGINVHKYGAHIFHTNNKEVWDFVKDTQYAYMFAYLLHSDPTDPHFKDIQVTEITRKTMLMGGNSAEDKIQVLDATKSLPGEKYGIEIKE